MGLLDVIVIFGLGESFDKERRLYFLFLGMGLLKVVNINTMIVLVVPVVM